MTRTVLQLENVENGVIVILCVFGKKKKQETLMLCGHEAHTFSKI